MLHTETVAETTLDILNRLLSLPDLATFGLVGGTNLSLRFGHRISVDLDLFTAQPFDLSAVQEAIRAVFPRAIGLSARKQTLLLIIEQVKVDLLLHDYPHLQPIEVVNGIRLVSLPDVIAMKLGAVAGRGAKKDFWDIDRLLRQYTLAEMIQFYTQKYPRSDPGQVVRSLVYFEDAEEQENPIDLQGTDWALVKMRITSAVQQYVQDLMH